jgi:hypothetical protein
MRCRCKVILGFVQGKSPTVIRQGGQCAKSQVYRVADRFIEHGLVGLAHRREHDGEDKVPNPARLFSALSLLDFRLNRGQFRPGIVSFHLPLNASLCVVNV